MEPDPRARFVDELKQLRAQAGQPTLDALQKQDPTWLVQQTVSRLLAGGFILVPPWERIAAFVAACVQIGNDKKLTMPPGDVLLDQWRHRYEALTLTLEQGRPCDSRPPADSKFGTATRRQQRRFGSVPSRVGGFQHRTIAATLARSVEGGGTAVLTGAATATPTSVLTGLGGVGKTQLAADHAHTVWDERQVELLVWISARTRDAITARYAEVAVELLGEDPATPERAWRRLLEWLAETPDRWLVVLDDVQRPSDLAGLWPPHSASGQVVVTTRCRDAGLRGDRRRIIEVDLFTPAEAFAYLEEKLLDRADTGADDLAGLAEDLGWLPLALAQAAAYLINKPLLTVADYRARLANRRVKLRDLLPKHQELPDEHEQTVAATWSLSIEAADQLDPAGLARPVFELASLLDSAGIPAALFSDDATANYLMARLDREITTDEVLGGLEALHRFSLLTLAPAQPARAVRVHTVVQRVVRDTLSADALSDLAWAAADALLGAWPQVEHSQELTQALRSNVVTLQDITEDYLWQTDGGHRVLFRLGSSLGEAGLLDGALAATRRLHHQASARLGPDHAATRATRNDLAQWRGMTGDAAGAVADYQQLLTDALRVLEPDHPDTLAIRSNLAQWRGTAGDAAGAVADYQQLLTDALRVWGPDHPGTLAIRGNLARCRGMAGDAAGADTDQQQLLTEALRVLGPDHPEIFNIRSNLAHRRGEVGDVAGAADDYQQLLTEALQVLGPDHPYTFTIRSNLAQWRGIAGDVAGAIADYQQLLTDIVRVPGLDHPDIFTIRSNLARWRGMAGDVAGAVADQQQLLTEALQVLGPDHPDILTCRSNLAQCRGMAGDAAGAADDQQKVLTDAVRILGPDHPDIRNIRANLAGWRRASGAG
ncbi:tetratricopeptide repeat protein [Amycolatopsis sp. NPDC049159]|uniref:tetratricopeptide repeat protein n=1 Tax=Amycolatopsis sp. NPDC049159 TaxID=3157210 RepID=UPI003409DBB1